MRSSLHLESLISRPSKDTPFLTVVALLSMVSGSPPMYPSSRYPNVWVSLDLGCYFMDGKGEKGLLGLPCCIHVAQSWLNSS